MERRPRKFTVGLLAIIRIAMFVIQFRFDEMTTITASPSNGSWSAAPRAEQFALRTAS